MGYASVELALSSESLRLDGIMGMDIEGGAKCYLPRQIEVYLLNGRAWRR
jgi:hypothetical protein